MNGRFLDTLDGVLMAALEGLSGRFVDAQVQFVLSRQQPDGGFAGREGAADVYYTDFAIRVLAMLSHGRERIPSLSSPGIPGAGSEAASTDIIHCFSRLNIARLLGQAMPQDSDLPLRRHLRPDGGFSRTPGGPVSAYLTFLAALCYEMLACPMPRIDEAVRAVASLQQSNSGFSELPGQAFAQTNATAAAIAFLKMHDALPDDTAAQSADFLAEMQSPQGGLRAHADAPADLLSTFTGLLTLSSLDAFDRIDAAAAARFVRDCACPTGGFLASPNDTAADVEYTYYGLGTLALLRMSAA